MSNNLGARRDGTNFISSTGPDVCLTPMGSAKVPVAYSSIAFLGSAARANKSVRLNGKAAFSLNGRAPRSMGTEPGIDKGLADSGHLGPAAVKTASGSTFVEGWATVSNGDPAWINMASQGATEAKR